MAGLSAKTILRIGLGLLLIAASISKLADPQAFLLSIEAYRLPIGGWLVKSTAIALPWLQIALGLLLIVERGPEAPLIAAGLFAVFFLVTLSAAVRGLDISCGCFTTERFFRAEWIEVLENPFFATPRNALLTVAAIYAAQRTSIETEAV